MFKLLFKKKTLQASYPDAKPLLLELGFEEDVFLVGFNEHIHKEVYVYNHKLIPPTYISSYGFKNGSKKLPDGRTLLDSNYSFNDSFLRSDSLPHAGGAREEWRFKKYDAMSRWLSDVPESYRVKGYAYASFDLYTMQRMTFEMHSEIMRLVDSDKASAIKLVALLIATNFQHLPPMVYIAKNATNEQIIQFVELLSKAEDMKLPIKDYQLLFETM